MQHLANKIIKLIVTPIKPSIFSNILHIGLTLPHVTLGSRGVNTDFQLKTIIGIPIVVNWILLFYIHQQNIQI